MKENNNGSKNGKLNINIRVVNLKVAELEERVVLAEIRNNNTFKSEPLEAFAYCHGYAPIFARKFSQRNHPPSILIYSGGLYTWLPIQGSARSIIRKKLVNIQCPYCKECKKEDREYFSPEAIPI